MTVSSLIDFESKEWDARLLEQYVDQEDIPMIQSLAISPNHRRDTFCWSYTKNGQYTVKSGYWVATNLMRTGELSSTPSSSQTFPVPSVYANMDYHFWRKNNIMKPEDDRDPYPWIIWYIWNARNDKLFRGIDRDPLELVRYAESECQAWHNAKEIISPPLQGQP
ncbi:hypothetical protein F2Q68_00032668 [Brassica cretica]|uniref:Uncharacterized protein n=2 Tax=Brassica cretica TaxID=69181 RepID=A0A8S9GIJ7_BRACR|nr:hypothetical protein F2Q68_00032668 [Brassica cretica]KAF3548642.1 hypothetical protein DY000_02006783 [Brassica cretica]